MSAPELTLALPLNFNAFSDQLSPTSLVGSVPDAGASKPPLGPGEPGSTPGVALEQTPSSERPRAILIPLSEVVSTEVEWLWPGAIAIGKLTLIVGDPGLGKSFVSLDLAARVSTGREWPGGSASEQEPASVLLIAAEDGHADTIKPRLTAAGADMNLIAIFDCPLDEHGKREWFDLRKHVPELEWAIRQRAGTKLIVIGPMTAFGGGVNERSQGAVREMLQPLADMAERLQVAVVLVGHTNKNDGAKAINKTTGSQAFVAIARTAWLVAKDASDGARRLFLPIKNNLASDSEGFAFSIPDGTKVEWEPDPVYISADEALAAENKARQEPGKLDDAIAFLRDTLSKGPIAANRIWELGEMRGLCKRTLSRAKGAEQIKSKRLNTPTGVQSFWHLPGMAPNSIEECQGWQDESLTEQEFREEGSREEECQDHWPVFGDILGTLAEGHGSQEEVVDDEVSDDIPF